MIHFIMHRANDSVGVVVVEGVRTGMALDGWIMEGDRTLKLKAAEDIPIGHKLAVRDIRSGDTVVKYGLDMGRAIADIRAGTHAHVHNIKTKRW